MARLKAPQRKQQLIDVATKLFAKSGYDATTTAAIADAAGVTEPILYRHFRSKAEMFVAIVRETSTRTVNSWREIAERVDDPAERVRTICKAIPSHIRSMADHYHVLHGAMTSSRDKKVKGVLQEHYENMEKFFAQIVSEGQQAGVFRKDMDASAVAWQIVMTGVGYAMLTLNLDRIVSDRVAEATIESIVRGMRS